MLLLLLSRFSRVRLCVQRLPCPWDSPGKNTGVGCHFLLQCMKVKSEREVAQSCPTLRDPLDCSPPGSSVHGISQVRVLEWAPSPSPRKRMKCIKLYMKCYDIAEVDCDKLNTLPINLKTINKPHTKEP